MRVDVGPAPNRVWVCDITYLPTREGWLYLAVVVHVCSRRVVGWAMASQQTRDLADRALAIALLQRRPGADVVTTTVGASTRAPATGRMNIALNMSRPGMPYDNATAESFFSTLKLELNPERVFISREAARLAVFDYIEASTVGHACTRRWIINRRISTESGSTAWGMCPRSTVRGTGGQSTVTPRPLLDIELSDISSVSRYVVAARLGVLIDVEAR